MPDRYGKEFVTKVGEILKALQKEGGLLPSYEIVTPDGWAAVPVLEICRVIGAADEETGIEFSDEVSLMRHMTLGKKIVIELDGKELGSFIPNKMEDNFDLFPPFAEHPLALRALMNVCTAYVLKKSVPPRKPQATPAAETGARKA